MGRWMRQQPFDFSGLRSMESVAVVCQGQVLEGKILVAYKGCFACIIEYGRSKLLVFDSIDGRCVDPDVGTAYAVRVMPGKSDADRAKIISMLEKHQKEVSHGHRRA